MPNWTTFSLAELRASTKAEITGNVRQWMMANLTRRQIIAWLMDADRIPDRTIVTRDDQGRVVKMVKVWRDPETGDRLGGEVMTWQYFATGEIRFIAISDRDGDNVETRRQRIQHFRDRRQPRMEDVIIAQGELEL
jgi:hypothetical protein